MNKEFDQILSTLGIQPTLVDVGASGAPPKVWEPIAKHSVYVGFDPDLRELHDVPDEQYARSIIVNEAVTSEAGQENVHFDLVHSPFCSSTLPPNADSQASYIYSDLFVVEGKVSVSASTLSEVLKRLDLPGIDWFKTDSQGTDLRLFQSLPDKLRSKVLAVDIEPGLFDAYQGEDVFAEAHTEITRQGFWLSHIKVCGTARMQRSTSSNMSPEAVQLIEQHQRTSPAWCEARYLRTIDWLNDHSMSAYRYRLLWIFALVDEQYGFALDVANTYGQKFGIDEFTDILTTIPLITLKDRVDREQSSKRKLRYRIGKLARQLGF